jgi:hypothetical protein
MHWPTIAPAAIRFYGQSAIPGWNYSLLIPSLKNGLFRLKLKADGLSVDSTVNPTDTLHYLAGYRLRNITIAPTGDTLFVAVDNSCCTLGTTGTIGNSIASPDLGFILRMVYLETLSLPVDSLRKRPPSSSSKEGIRVYPNPAHGVVHIDGPRGGRRPWVAQLYTVTGQPVSSEEVYGDSFSMDIRYLPPGVYILHLIDGMGRTILIYKLLIE